MSSRCNGGSRRTAQRDSFLGPTAAPALCSRSPQSAQFAAGHKEVQSGYIYVGRILRRCRLHTRCRDGRDTLNDDLVGFGGRRVAQIGRARGGRPRSRREEGAARARPDGVSARPSCATHLCDTSDITSAPAHSGRPPPPLYSTSTTAHPTTPPHTSNPTKHAPLPRVFHALRGIP